MNIIQERALKVEYDDNKLSLSELLNVDKSVTVDKNRTIVKFTRSN